MLKSMDVPESVLSVWVEELKQGDTNHIEDVFRVHADFPRAVSVAYRKAIPHLNDDILSAANEGLVNAVNAVIQRGQEFHGTNISGFVTVTIRNAIRDVVQHNPMVRIPRNTFKKLFDALPDDREYVFIDLRTAFDFEGPNHFHGSTMEDLCQHLDLDATETKIVMALDQGYSQIEIAAMLSVSPSAVNQRLSKIKKRFIADFQYEPGANARRTQVEV